MKKGDVGMAKHFSIKYGNKGWAFDYPVSSAIWNKFLFCQEACQWLMLHPYITASKATSSNFILSAVRVQQNEYLINYAHLVGLWLILAYDWPYTHAALKVLHLLYRKEITYILQPRFCKVDYWSVNVQCPNSTQNNTILMLFLEVVM